MKMHKFDEMATNVFGKIYPVIATQAIERTGIKEGICIDIGSGGGHLGLAVAEISDMKVYLCDISQEAKDIADKKINEKDLKDRVTAIKADVHSLPFDDNSIDLIVSRASYNSWDDKVKAIKEIYRALKPGGKTYVGGGYGNEELKNEIEDKMIAMNAKGWVRGKNKNRDKLKSDILENLKTANIHEFELIIDESGYWIIIFKLT